MLFFGSCDVSIHSLRKKGDPLRVCAEGGTSSFNPLPSQEGRPLLDCQKAVRRVCFNPLPSQEGRPECRYHSHQSKNVSIHSLRKKGDRKPYQLTRAPESFQSTPFARRETVNIYAWKAAMHVSIHSLRKKGDQKKKLVSTVAMRFNPLPSQEGRPINANRQ